MFRKPSMGLLAVTSLVVAGAMGADATAGNYRHCGNGYQTFIAHSRPLVQYALPVVRTESPREQHPSVPAGSTVTLPANFLGHEAGSVFMVFRHIKLPVQIVNWAEDGVTITLPPMALRHSAKVRVDVILPHGQVGLQKHLILTPPADVVLHPVAPTSPLPTNSALLGGEIIPTE